MIPFLSLSYKSNNFLAIAFAYSASHIPYGVTYYVVIIYSVLLVDLIKNIYKK